MACCWQKDGFIPMLQPNLIKERRPKMPGLLRGMARTAVIAGTATHVSNNVSRRQANRWQAEQAQDAPEQAVSAPAGDPMDDLKQLGQLHDSGVLTDEEFASKKAEILQRM